MLLDAGANVNAETIEQFTPLHCIAVRCNVSDDRVGIANLLLEYNAKQDSKTSNNQTASDLAKSVTYFSPCKREILSVL